MNKLKELWSYAVFRWSVYVTPLLVFGLLLSNAAFSGKLYFSRSRSFYYYKNYRVGGLDLEDYATLIWVFILALPAVWVWRKPIWKLVKQALGFLNKKAEEG